MMSLGHATNRKFWNIWIFLSVFFKEKVFFGGVAVNHFALESKVMVRSTRWGQVQLFFCYCFHCQRKWRSGIPVIAVHSALMNNKLVACTMDQFTEALVWQQQTTCDKLLPVAGPWDHLTPVIWLSSSRRYWRFIVAYWHWIANSRPKHGQQTRTSQSQWLLKTRLIFMLNLKLSEAEERSSTLQIQPRRFIKLIKDDKNLREVNSRLSWKRLDRFWASQSF